MNDVQTIEIDGNSRYLLVIRGAQMPMRTAEKVIEWVKGDEPMFILSIPGNADIQLVRVEREE